MRLRLLGRLGGSMTNRASCTMRESSLLVSNSTLREIEDERN